MAESYVYTHQYRYNPAYRRGGELREKARILHLKLSLQDNDDSLTSIDAKVTETAVIFSSLRSKTWLCQL